MSSANIRTERQLEREFSTKSPNQNVPYSDARVILDLSLYSVTTLVGFLASNFLKILVYVLRPFRRITGLKRQYDTQSPIMQRALLRSIKSDMVAGLTIAAMAIPQGISYSTLVGVPVTYGLHANIIYPLMYALMGTSPYIMVGTAAVENLIIGEALSSLLPGGSIEELVKASTLLSFFSGIAYLLFGLLNLASLAETLNDSVLSGFSIGTAYLVAISQLKTILGLSAISHRWGALQTFWYILSNLKLINVQSLILSILSITALVCIRRYTKLPAGLVMLVVGLFIGACADKYAVLLETVSTASGLSLPTLTTFSSLPISWRAGGTYPSVWAYVVQAIELSGILFIIHVSIYKTLARKHNSSSQPEAELTCYSIMNFIGAAFSCYPACTSISRTVMSESLKTSLGLQGISSAIAIIITIVLFGSLIKLLPLSILSSIVLVGISSILYEFGDFRNLWKRNASLFYQNESKHSTDDLILWAISFLGCIFFGATIGLICSIGLSVVLVARKIIDLEIKEIALLGTTTIFRDITRFGRVAVQDDNIAVYRIDGPLLFCNAGNIEKKLIKLMNHQFESSRTAAIPTPDLSLHIEKKSAVSTYSTNGLANSGDGSSSQPSRVFKYLLDDSSADFSFEIHKRVVIIDCSSINSLDVTSVGMIDRLAQYTRSQNILLLFSNWKGPQRDYLHQLGKLNTFLNLIRYA